MFEIRKIRPEELLLCARLGSLCFEYVLDTDDDAAAYYERSLREAPNALHKSGLHPMERYAAIHDGEVAAAVSAIPYRIDYDGGRASMCGIGGVCGHPAYRRQGAVRSVMLQILRDEQAKGTEWSVLYPFSQAFYGRFGYANSEPSCQTRFCLRYADKPEPAGSFSLYDGGEDYTAFREAYERMSGYNLKVRRERCDYHKLLKANPYKTNDFAYLYRDGGGVARGYFIFHKNQDEDSLMEVTELVFDSYETLRQIIGFAAGFATDYHDIRFTTPLRLCTEKLCRDYAQASFARQITANGMLRAVNIEAALRGAQYRGTGEAVLDISDEALGKNTRIALRYLDGVLRDLGESDLAPTIRMSIGDFSAALIGRYEHGDLAALPDCGCTDPSRLAGIFYRKPCHLINYF